MQLLAVFTTVSDADTANELARRAVEQELAACVQVEPISSTYRWQGRVETSNEWRLLFKTTQQRYPALQRWLSDVHPYELPAIYAVPVAEATSDYAAWVEDGVGPDADTPSDLLIELQRLETEFHHPGTGCSAHRLEELLHPGFFEIGRSGQRYDRDTVIRYLSEQPPPTSVVSWDFAVQPLGPDHALLTYHSAQRSPAGDLERHTHRSSVWTRSTTAWQILYHQGTPAA